MRRRLRIVPLLLCTAPAFASDTIVVTQINRAFNVAEISVHRGDTVRFVNRDDFDHQIYVEGGNFAFDTDEAEPGKTIDEIFSVNGRFEVRCHIHPRMRLVVHVE